MPRNLKKCIVWFVNPMDKGPDLQGHYGISLGHVL